MQAQNQDHTGFSCMEHSIVLKRNTATKKRRSEAHLNTLSDGERIAAVPPLHQQLPEHEHRPAPRYLPQPPVDAQLLNTH